MRNYITKRESKRIAGMTCIHSSKPSTFINKINSCTLHRWRMQCEKRKSILAFSFANSNESSTLSSNNPQTHYIVLSTRWGSIQSIWSELYPLLAFLILCWTTCSSCSWRFKSIMHFTDPSKTFQHLIKRRLITEKLLSISLIFTPTQNSSSSPVHVESAPELSRISQWKSK